MKATKVPGRVADKYYGGYMKLIKVKKINAKILIVLNKLGYTVMITGGSYEKQNTTK